MLYRFYTDACGTVGWGQALRLLGNFSSAQPLTRIAKRQLPKRLVGRTKTFFLPNMLWVLRRMFASSDEARFRQDARLTADLGRAAVRAGFGEATHLYSMLTEFPDLAIAARRKGITTVAEVYILISTERIVAAERDQFPEWEYTNYDSATIRREIIPEDVLFDYTDFYLCPSAFVRSDLIENWGVPADRILLVPYGIDPAWLSLKPTTRPGRVLFVGTAELRKGIHYLAMAAQKLANAGRKFEFRIAGGVTERIRNMPDCCCLTFLGRVPRHQIRSEFQKADLFVLPSLAEGSAEATYEALGAGLPVVTTEAAGSVVRDGIEGLIVNARDSTALAESIGTIVGDRRLRTRMSCAARARAREFTWAEYASRLTTALRSLPK